MAWRWQEEVEQPSWIVVQQELVSRQRGECAGVGGLSMAENEMVWVCGSLLEVVLGRAFWLHEVVVVKVV